MAKARGSIQNIYNTLAFMQALNPTLLSGQVAYYKDTVGNKLVVGDGVTPFMSLVPMFGASIIISAAIPLSSVGNNGDIAILTTPGQIAQKTGGAWAVVYTFPSGGGAGTVTAVNSITPTAGNVSLTADNIPAGTTNKYWTKAATDTYYLPLSGGTLVGPLVLSSDPTAALQAATKAYVDRAVLGAMKFQGVYSAATNLPNLPVPSTANNGFYWLLSDSGTQYGFNFNPGDWIVSNGQNYEQVNNTGPVFSVLGRTGAVIAVTGDYNTSQVTENTNLYFTSARATGSPLTGLNLSLTGAISASDTLLTAAARLQSQINSAVSVSSMNAAISAALVPYVTVSGISAVAILNQTAQQASSNFNISGAGVIGGTLTAGALAINYGTQTAVSFLASNMTGSASNGMQSAIVNTSQSAQAYSSFNIQAFSEIIAAAPAYIFSGIYLLGPSFWNNLAAGALLFASNQNGSATVIPVLNIGTAGAANINFGNSVVVGSNTAGGGGINRYASFTGTSGNFILYAPTYLAAPADNGSKLQVNGSSSFTGLITAAAANFSGIVGIGAAATAGIGLTITNAGTEGLRINATTGNSYLRFSVANTVMATMGTLNSGLYMNLAGNFYCNPGISSALILPGGTITSGINRGGISFNVDGNQGVGNTNVFAGFSGQYNYDNLAGSHLWTSTAVSQASPTQAITVSQVLSIDKVGNGKFSGGIKAGTAVTTAANNLLSSQNVTGTPSNKYQILSIGATNQISFFAETNGSASIGFNTNTNAGNTSNLANEAGFAAAMNFNQGTGAFSFLNTTATLALNASIPFVFAFTIDNLGNGVFSGAITSKGTNKQIVTIATNYTVLVTDEVIQCQGTTGAYTITLPTATAVPTGRIITLIRDPNSSGATITVTVATLAAIQTPAGGYSATVSLGLGGAAGSRLSYINNGSGGWVLLSSF